MPSDGAGRSGDGTDRLCQRCEENEARSEFTHGAIEGLHTYSYDICEDCLVSLGEWFRGGAADAE